MIHFYTLEFQLISIILNIYAFIVYMYARYKNKKSVFNESILDTVVNIPWINYSWLVVGIWDIIYVQLHYYFKIYSVLY